MRTWARAWRYLQGVVPQKPRRFKKSPPNPKRRERTMDSNQDKDSGSKREQRRKDPGTLVIDYAEITPESALQYRKKAVNRKTKRRHQIEDEFARRVFAPDSHVVDIPCAMAGSTTCSGGPGV